MIYWNATPADACSSRTDPLVMDNWPGDVCWVAATRHFGRGLNDIPFLNIRDAILAAFDGL